MPTSRKRERRIIPSLTLPARWSANRGFPMKSPLPPDCDDLALLWPLSRQFPSIDAALAEVARLSAELMLPKGTVHVISDVHGEHLKLRHVINNASGTLRPLVERLFADELSPQ